MRSAIGLLVFVVLQLACDQANTARGETADADAAPPGVDSATTLPSMLEAVRAIGEQAIDPDGGDGKTVGLAVGIWSPSYQGTLGFGRARAGTTSAVDGETVFEIGSVTKVFTGMLLADRVIAGRAKLDDSLSGQLPDAPVPSFQGQTITLAHLASHGSGLPYMPDNLVGTSFNPAAGYTRELLWDFLSRTSLTRPPGTSYRYSNIGIGLLGMALSRQDGNATYESMLASRITGPLEMRDTRIDRTKYSETKLAYGHRRSTPTPPNQIDVLEAAGALRSTARDMVKFLAAHVRRGHPMDSVVDLVQTKVIARSPDEACGLALEIRTETGGTYFEKIGATSGFTAKILFSREPAVGVVVLANSAGADVAHLAREIHRVASRP